MPLTMVGRRKLGCIRYLYLSLRFIMIAVTVDAVNLTRSHGKKSAVSSPVDLFVGMTIVQDAVTKGAGEYISYVH